MSTKVEKSRSELIREYLKSVRSEEQKKPTAVTAALKEKGIQVTPGLVSQIKNKLGNKKRRKKVKAVAKKTKVAKKEITLDNLIHAKNLLHVFNGDIKAARSALETVKKLIS